MSLGRVARFRLINGREMLAHKGRTIVSIIVIAVAAALLVAIAGIYGSITGSVNHLTQSIAGNSDFEITSIADSGMAQDLLPALRHEPGVKTAVPMVRYSVGVGNDRILIVGVDASFAQMQSDLQGIIQAQLSQGLPLDGVIAGPGLGKQRGETLQIGTETQKVSQVVEGDAAKRLNDGRFVVTLLGVAQKLTNRPGRLDSVFIVAQPGIDLRGLHDELAAAVGGRAVVAVPQFRAAQSSNATALASYSTLLVGFIALVVSGFLIFNSMNTTAAQRRPRIASLRALGGEATALCQDLLIEAALIGLVGGLVGIPVGMLAGMLAIKQLPPILVQSIDARIDYVTPTLAIPVVLALTVCTTLLASGVAARAVSRVSPIEAMNPREILTSDENYQAFRRTAGVVGLVCVCAAGVVAAMLRDQRAIIAAGLCALGSLALAYWLQIWIVSCAKNLATAMGAAGTLGATVIQRAPRRAWATAMTIALVVAVATATSGSLNNVADAASETFSSLAKADLYISATTQDMIPTGPILPTGLAARVQRIPGVAQVLPVQYAYANLGASRVLMEGAEAGSATPAFSAMLPDVRERVSRGDGVVISRQLARSLNVGPGQKLEVPSASGPRKVQILQVIDYVTMDAGLIALSLAQMEQWLQRDGATYLEVTFTPNANKQTTFDAVRAAVPSDISVYSGATALTATRGLVAQMGVLAIVTQWIVAALGAIAVLNTLMLSVLDRKRELGIIRALGATRKTTAAIVLSEAAGLGLAGALLGIVFGELLHYLGTVALSAATSITVRYEVSYLAPLSIVTALALCMAGAFAPARYAARLDILDSINNE